MQPDRRSEKPIAPPSKRPSFSAIIKGGLVAMPRPLGAHMLAAVDNQKVIHRMLAAEMAAVLRKLSKSVADAGWPRLMCRSLPSGRPPLADGAPEPPHLANSCRAWWRGPKSRTSANALTPCPRHRRRWSIR